MEGGRRSTRLDVADFAAQEVISVPGSAASWLHNREEITLPPLPMLQQGCPGLDHIADTNHEQSLGIFRRFCNASLLRKSAYSNGHNLLLTCAALITLSSQIRFSLYKKNPTGHSTHRQLKLGSPKA